MVLKTIYGKWTANTYTVKYHANKGSGAYGPEKNLVYGEGITLPGEEVFTRTGYELIGWNTKNNGKGITYLPEEDYSKSGIDVKEKGTITLYAVWKPVSYKITYIHEDTQGNLLEELEDIEVTPQSYTIENHVWLSKPKKDGFLFKGWYTENGRRIYFINKSQAKDYVLYGR